MAKFAEKGEFPTVQMRSSYFKKQLDACNPRIHSTEEVNLTQQRFIILSLEDFKLATICTLSAIVPLLIPPACPLTHLPSLRSLMLGSTLLCACSEDQQQQENVLTGSICSLSISISAIKKYSPGKCRVQKVKKIISMT